MFFTVIPFFLLGVFSYSFRPWSVCAKCGHTSDNGPAVEVWMFLQGSLIYSGNMSGFLPVICCAVPFK